MAFASSFNPAFRFSFASTSKPFTFTGQSTPSTSNPPAKSSTSFSSTFSPPNPAPSHPFSALAPSKPSLPSTLNTSSFFPPPQTTAPATSHQPSAFTNVISNPFSQKTPASTFFDAAPAKTVFPAMAQTTTPRNGFEHVNTNPFAWQPQQPQQPAPFQSSQPSLSTNTLQPTVPAPSIQPVSFFHQPPFTFQSPIQPAAPAPVPALALGLPPSWSLGAPLSSISPAAPFPWQFQPLSQPPQLPFSFLPLPSGNIVPPATPAPVPAPSPVSAPAPAPAPAPEPSLFTRIDDNPFRGLSSSSASACSDGAAGSAVDFTSARVLPPPPSLGSEKNLRLLAPLPSTSFKPTHHKTRTILSQSLLRASRVSDASVRAKLGLPSYNLDQFVPCRTMKKLAILPPEEEDPPFVVAAPPASPPRRNRLFLSDPEYFVLPSPEYLQALSDTELARVENLVIGKSGCGTVKFLEPVDLTTEGDLCQTVKFFSRGVDVATKKGLSVPARVRIENCFVRDKGQPGEAIKDETSPRAARLVQKLKTLPNTRFLGYDINAGIWNFEICPVF